MARPNLKAVKAAPKEDPWRRQLAEAIEAKAAADKKLAAVHAAGEAAWREAASLSVKLKEAEEAIVEAEKAEVQARIRRQMGEAPEAGQTVAAAKRKVEDRRHEIATVDRARSELEAAETEAKHQSHMHRGAVEHARDELLRNSPEMARLLNDLKIAEATEKKLRRALRALPPGVLPLYNSSQNLVPDDEIDSAPFEAWRTAIEKLSVDANTQLP
jgi:chromosome segregation ATPase